MRGELSAGVLVSLDSGKCYAVAGIADTGVTSMDLLITAPSGAWVARTEQPVARPLLRFCAKQTGPYRVATTFTGRGEYLLGVYGPKPIASAAGSSSSPLASAVVSAEPAMSSSKPAAGPATCAPVGESAPFQRMVSGGERGCRRDDDCISVKTDCSQLSCAGINRAYRGSYSAPLDCRGYRGAVGNYDCDPQFGIETPRCRDGCCVSERVEKGH